MSEKLRGLAAKGLTQSEAARKLGVSRQRVSQVAARLGLAFRRGAPPIPEERLKELARKGLTRTEAARELGVPLDHVRSQGERLQLSFAPAWSRPKAPTTEFGRILQAARLASGYSYSRLAVLSGLNRHHVTDLDLGRVRQPKEKTLRALAHCLGGPALYEELARAVHEAAAPMQRGARN